MIFLWSEKHLPVLGGVSRETFYSASPEIVGGFGGVVEANVKSIMLCGDEMIGDHAEGNTQGNHQHQNRDGENLQLLLEPKDDLLGFVLLHRRCVFPDRALGDGNGGTGLDRSLIHTGEALGAENLLVLHIPAALDTLHG